MLETTINQVRQTTPLVHCITNYVTVNDCANILLACGGSPIMADDMGEVEEITSICGALVLNIGTLNERTIASMHAAGRRAASLSHPVILDPVGAGASKLRTQTALALLPYAHVVRGNISEIRALSNNGGATQGVDAAADDAVSENNLDHAVNFIREFAKNIGKIVAATGAIDIVSDDQTTYIIRNGHPLMSKITGTGCMLSSIMGAYCCANPQNMLEATAASVCAMGLCGETAYAQGIGTGSYRTGIIDAMSRLDAEKLREGARIEKR